MRVRRRSLTWTFGLVSLLCLTTLGAILMVVVTQTLREQALAEAVRTATAYAKAGVQEQTVESDWTNRDLSADSEQGLADLRNRTSGFRLDDTLLAVRLWAPQGGEPLYASDRDPNAKGGGNVVANNLRLVAATQGNRPSAALVDGLAAGDAVGVQTVLDVYVPMVFDKGGTGDRAGSGKVVGAAEIVLNYEPAQEATWAALRTIGLVIFGGLVVVWVLLFRTVRRASRRLRRSAVENARLALLDPLTGLPNRRLFSERLERAVREREDDQCIALVLLDINQFKEINDSLGHDRGDDLLIEVAARLGDVVRDSDTVARLGGDEFAVLLPGVRNVDDAAILAERVLSVFAQPYDIDGLVLHVETSLGLALLPDHASDESSLLRRADIAMYAAKGARRGMSVYSADTDSDSPAKLVLLGDLRQAIDAEEQLSVHFQPKLDLNTGRVAGVEALLRWNHPTRGNIPPDQFIPLAEQTGLVHSLTRRVMQLVLEQMREWRAQDRDIKVAVNLSAMNLAEPDLDERIQEMLDDYGVPARFLEFEITESAIVSDPERAARTLRRLAAMGSTIALDDFGIGNTSISQLRNLPIDTIKIDRSFVTDLDAGSAVLVKVVTDLAHEFAMVAVAEGVEDAHVADRLRVIGCDLAQGYLYARPVPASELLEILDNLEADSSKAVANLVLG